MNLADYQFYQVIELPDGRLTKGITDHRGDIARMGLDRPELFAGKRVLDVAANDGFWSFWSERAGASEVVATDVDFYSGYDWGFGGPPAAVANSVQQNKSRAFFALRQELQSSVRRERCSVYDITPDRFGQFDAIFFYGLLYHLRHPLLAFDRMRRVSRGFMIVESHVNNALSALPHALFYWDDVYYAPTNWHGPSEACVVAWGRSAGFDSIFVERSPRTSPARQKFVMTSNEALAEYFKSVGALRYCDAAYFAEMRACVEEHVKRSVEAP